MIEVSALPPKRPTERRGTPDDSGAWGRRALIAAARAFLADRRTAVSAQEIANRAHVSVGVFHSNFSSTDQLFEITVATTVAEYARLRDEMVDGIDDPAEVYATGCRINGRMQRRLPEHVKVLLAVGTRLLHYEKNLSSRARLNLAAAAEQGRFDIEDVELAYMTGAGALLGLMQLLDSDPTLDAAKVSDEFTERLLRALGMDAAEAREICSRPLPELPNLR